MRETTWSRIGTDVSKATTLDEVLGIAGLDYNVVKTPIYTMQDGKLVEYTDKVATVNELTGETFGIVSPRYEICQNAAAFDFINSVTDEVEFVKAGTTHTGMVYIIAKMRNQNVLGDEFTPYIIFQNSHNGEYTLKATISPLRIVCQNQFNVAFRDSSNTITIRHSSLLESRMDQGRELLGNTAEYIKHFNAEAEALATIKVDYKKKKRLLDKMFAINPEHMSERVIQNVEASKARFLEAYDAEDNQNFKGTAWGFLNAYADWSTHAPLSNRANAADNAFMNISLLSNGMNNIVKQLAG